ncbi:U6 snRNA phosphodiesterase Usb1 [Xylariaceae sp. FL1019]|nr:U6 snRNA phosphodiesterase Usb1 [Xylariaceae sp. FL1019]
MGLVDYSSDSSSSSDNTRVKKQKTSHEPSSATEETDLPPLPSAFHDLYASTVRVSTSDDPTLHQGRQRVNPHKVGNWPSHLYVEWHPTSEERTILITLLAHLQSTLSSSSSSSPATITSFLTSDLNTPLPLHISLSRPIVLSTSQKDDFLTDLESSIKASSISPFDVAPLDLAWHRSHESARSFLVLRVGSVRANSTREGKTSAEDEKTTCSEENPNPQLTALLKRSNDLVTRYGQPALYTAPSTSAQENKPDVGTSFHVSIAWSFAEPTIELRTLTSDVLNGATKPTSASVTTSKTKDELRQMRIRVDGIKAKIGNIVSHVPLPDRRSRGTGRGLFGI